jgi:hypothetical protein
MFINILSETAFHITMVDVLFLSYTIFPWPPGKCYTWSHTNENIDENDFFTVDNRYTEGGVSYKQVQWKFNKPGYYQFIIENLSNVYGETKYIDVYVT